MGYINFFIQIFAKYGNKIKRTLQRNHEKRFDVF
jgi:hypothetical protein